MSTLLVGLMLAAPSAWAEEATESSSARRPDERLDVEVERHLTEMPEHLLEFSFGSSLLYVEQPLHDGYAAVTESRVLPVPSVLVLGEWLVRPRWIIAGILNIPTAPIRVLKEDGETYTEESATAAVAIGGAHVPFQVRVGDKSIFQPQLGLMVGRSINHSVEDTFFPMAVCRLHLHTQTGFSMYFGAAFAGRRDTLALIYGVGHRF